MLEDFYNEKADFMTIAYEKGVKDIQDKTTAQCPWLDLGFLNELFASEEGKVMADPSKDNLAFIATDAFEDPPASAL